MKSANITVKKVSVISTEKKTEASNPTNYVEATEDVKKEESEATEDTKKEESGGYDKGYCECPHCKGTGAVKSEEEVTEDTKKEESDADVKKEEEEVTDNKEVGKKEEESDADVKKEESAKAEDDYDDDAKKEEKADPTGATNAKAMTPAEIAKTDLSSVFKRQERFSASQNEFTAKMYKEFNLDKFGF